MSGRHDWRATIQKLADRRIDIVGPEHDLNPTTVAGWVETMILTFIAALRCDAIIALLVLDQPINGEWFLAHVEQALVPTLKPGDVVVMGNLGIYKSCAVRQAIRMADAHLLFLPPYSPDLNPIEQVFSKLKTLLRKADERCVEIVWRRIGQLLDCFSPTECANHLVNSGYAPS